MNTIQIKEHAEEILKKNDIYDLAITRVSRMPDKKVYVFARAEVMSSGLQELFMEHMEKLNNVKVRWSK